MWFKHILRQLRISVKAVVCRKELESEQVVKTVDNAVQTSGHKTRMVAGRDMGQRKGLLF